jgi:hypothetical protein
MISLFRKMVRDKTLIMRSPWVVSEMSTLEFNMDKQRIQASQDMHDDRIMGPAMLITSWYDPEIYGTIPSAYKDQREFERQLQTVPVYTGDVILGRASRTFAPQTEKEDSRSITYVS